MALIALAEPDEGQDNKESAEHAPDKDSSVISLWSPLAVRIEMERRFLP